MSSYLNIRIKNMLEQRCFSTLKNTRYTCIHNYTLTFWIAHTDTCSIMTQQSKSPKGTYCISSKTQFPIYLQQTFRVAILRHHFRNIQKSGFNVKESIIDSPTWLSFHLFCLCTKITYTNICHLKTCVIIEQFTLTPKGPRTQDTFPFPQNEKFNH